MVDRFSDFVEGVIGFSIGREGEKALAPDAFERFHGNSSRGCDGGEGADTESKRKASVWEGFASDGTDEVGAVVGGTVLPLVTELEFSESPM